jgi:DNA replication initiation complex subunit (GINS family)
MQVICLKETAFYTLVEQVVARLHEKSNSIHEKWIDDEAAMQLLNIKSKMYLDKVPTITSTFTAICESPFGQINLK